ncbi:MAG: SPOR domain-containing protein [Candidatus Neomarinimicrobiota bacterium]|nr:SPOR domain-containing protein [Candidatus Neomarinimicrobiota bacterium]
MLFRSFNLFLIASTVFLKAQNIDLYITLLEKGKISEVKENLPELIQRYPKDPGIFFLKGLVSNSADEALLNYETLIKDYPNSEYASLSEMKIGEYLFARGLYSQASNQFKKTIINYPIGDHHQMALDLMVNSYLAIGDDDSLKIALINIKDLYPKLDYNKYGINGLNNEKREAKLVRLDAAIITNRFKEAKEKRQKTKIISKPKVKPWVVQVGAFGKYNNAKRLRNQLQNNGFIAEIHTIYSNGGRLHAVRIVRYEDQSDAEKIGRKLKKKFGLDFRVINNPE